MFVLWSQSKTENCGVVLSASLFPFHQQDRIACNRPCLSRTHYRAGELVSWSQELYSKGEATLLPLTCCSLRLFQKNYNSVGKGFSILLFIILF